MELPGGSSEKKSTTPAASDARHAGLGFSGLSFQHAQEKIVADMIRHKVDKQDGFAAFEVFINLPPRSLKDYYQVISYPLSLRKLQKRVLGIHGRQDSTGATDFRTWAAFEMEASNIWKNAFQYNEDGSEISNLAKDLETFFTTAVEEAKKKVPEPIAPKIRLKMPEVEHSKITLKLGGRTSAANSPIPQTNGSGQSGHDVNQNPGAHRTAFGGSASDPLTKPEQEDRTRSISASVASVASPTSQNSIPVKNETLRNSPLPMPGYSTHRSISQIASNALGGMPPPKTPVFPHHIAQQTPPVAQSPGYHTSYASYTAFENASHALIQGLTINTHPGLNLSRHLYMHVSPHDRLAQQSIVINLPHAYCFLQVKPELAPSLNDRQYKLFVTSGNQRLQALPSQPGEPLDRRRPNFEVRLLLGVNKIEIELIAALPRAGSGLATGPEVEHEQITIFAHLMKP